MSEISVTDTQEEARRKRSGKVIGIAAAVAIVICAAVVLLVVQCTAKNRYDPPVIQGVQERIEVYEDEDIPSILLDGVTAVGGADRADQVFPVSVSVLLESGQEVSEYPPGTYRLIYRCQDDTGLEAEPVESVLVVAPADREAPTIEGAQDLTTAVDQPVSYRSGVTAVDNVDEAVQLQVDAAQVNLTQPGEYPVTYSATDSSGNRATVTVTLTVVEAPAEEQTETGISEGQTAEQEGVTQAQLDALADRILSQIITSGMSQRQKAKAIYDYVNSHIKYVGTSDKSSWIKGAYIGFTQGRGDCFNYYACSKELLTRAGIPNIDVRRVGGTTDHYWQLVNVGDGWYHFDTCPHPTGYPIYSFLLTEAEVRDYTVRCSSVRKNYYVYDYSACPVTVVGTPQEEVPEDPVEPAQALPSEQPQAQEEEPPPLPSDPVQEEELFPPTDETAEQEIESEIESEETAQ